MRVTPTRFLRSVTNLMRQISRIELQKDVWRTPNELD
jgi:hypothetical protein